jgi:broad specificity phosphatase PhoE
VSRLFVIRHGQASFGAEDYDQLSDLGAEQSRLLGAHLARHGHRLDAIYTGPRRRHHGTTTALREGAGAAGMELPEATMLEGLDEFPAFELFAQHAKQPAGDILREGGSKKLLRTIEEVCEKWMLGELDSGELESAADFEARVLDAFSRIRSEQGRGKTVAVVTSGGPVTISVKAALGLDPRKASELLWVIVNSAVTELLYRDDTMSLVGFNRVAHLTRQHITHR